MKDENCIFCKLAGGEIPTATLYEDEDFWMQILRQKDMRLLFPRSIMQICMSWMMSWPGRCWCWRRR